MKIDSTKFEASLKRTLEDIANDAVKEVKKAAYEIRNEAIKKTPVNTGALRAAWKIRESSSATTYKVTVSNSTPYARAIEYGTRPYTVKAKNKKVLADKKTNRFFGKKVRIPSRRPRPMLRPAIAKVLPILKERIRRLI